jgi:hypothetical protein
LLVEVVFNVHGETRVCLQDIIQWERIPGRALCRAIVFTGDNVAHDILGTYIFAASEELQGNLHRSHGATIGIILGVFAKLLLLLE